MKSAEMSKILSMLDKMAFQELLTDIRGKSLEHYHQMLNQGFTSEDALLDTIAQARLKKRTGYPYLSTRDSRNPTCRSSHPQIFTTRLPGYILSLSWGWRFPGAHGGRGTGNTGQPGGGHLPP